MLSKIIFKRTYGLHKDYTFPLNQCILMLFLEKRQRDEDDVNSCFGLFMIVQFSCHVINIFLFLLPYHM